MTWTRRQRAIARAFGRQGAKRRMRVLSEEVRKQIARHAVTARWAKTSPEERSQIARKAVAARWRKAGKPATRRRRAGLPGDSASR
jgi:hypothetical protein